MRHYKGINHVGCGFISKYLALQKRPPLFISVMLTLNKTATEKACIFLLKTIQKEMNEKHHGVVQEAAQVQQRSTFMHPHRKHSVIGQQKLFGTLE